MRHILCIATACLFGATSLAFAAGEIYRWKDANGIWHYADQPQPGAELISGTRRPPPTPAASTPTPPVAQNNAAPPPLPGISSQVAQEVRAEAATAKAEQCKKAEASYQQAIQARRMYRTDAQGNRTFLSDAELDAARLQARSTRDLACNP
ncbi:MAG: DUF4124 domain-containing protein [Steroidobacteraceae bacterium]